MADEVRVAEDEADEAGESIHLPGPSYQPVVLAFGLTLAITGVVIFPAMSVIGLVIVLVVLYMWIRDTRRETRELPLEHEH
jgi:cytochrome c oxidase subunit IV